MCFLEYPRLEARFGSREGSVHASSPLTGHCNRALQKRGRSGKTAPSLRSGG